MKLYELAYIINPKIQELDLMALQEKIVSFLEEGVLVEQKTPAKRKLSFPIKKCAEAYLGSMVFNLEPAKTFGLKKKIEAEQDLLRYLLLAKSLPKKRPERKRLAIPTETPTAKKVELKKIDEKLEEILKD